jgi:hypothetical protein
VYVERHASRVLVEKEREGTSLDYELVGRHGCWLHPSGAPMFRDVRRTGWSRRWKGYTAAVTTVLVYKRNGTGSDRSVINDIDGILLALPI